MCAPVWRAPSVAYPFELANWGTKLDWLLWREFQNLFAAAQCIYLLLQQIQ